MNYSHIILFSLLIFNSCVRNTISIYVNPNGNFNMIMHAHGDENDILDADFPMPHKYDEWKVNTTIDSIVVDTHDMVAIKHFKTNETIPNNFSIKSNKQIHPLLKHNIKVKYRNWLLYKNYSINIIFKSRLVDQKYPQFISLINNPESVEDGWAKEVFSYLFKETLHRTNLEFNQKAMIERDLNTWIQTEIFTKNDSIIIEKFEELKDEGLDLLMHPINPNFYTEIDSIFNYLEQEYKITQLLIDDEFEIKLFLPGVLKESNYQELNADTLVWAFSLKDFMNSDYRIYANSQIYYQNRTIASIILSLLLIIYLLLKRRK